MVSYGLAFSEICKSSKAGERYTGPMDLGVEQADIFLSQLDRFQVESIRDKTFRNIKRSWHSLLAGCVTTREQEGQATKGVRWMPRRLLAMKDVEGCEKLWGAAKQASIHRYPNGETRLILRWVIYC